MLREWAERLRQQMMRVPPTWQRRLHERGLDPFVLRELSRTADLDAAWPRCRRVDWALEIAVRAPVEEALVTEGLVKVGQVFEEWGVDPESLLAHVRRLEGTEEALEAWLAVLSAELLRLIDFVPEVRSKLLLVQKAERWRDRAKLIRCSDAYDSAHASAHRGLTRTFQRSVPVAALRIVLEDRKAHPYR